VKSDHKTEHQIEPELEATEDVHRSAANLETQQQIDLIIDTLPALLAYVNAEQRYLYVNRLYADWYGLAREEIIGKHVRDILPETTYQGALPSIEVVLSGQRITYENAVYDTQGQPRTVRATYVPHLDENGQAKAFLAMVEDITERKQAEQEIQDLARFPGENPNPVLRLDGEGEILYANETSLPLLDTWGCRESRRLPDEWREIISRSLASGARDQVETRCGEHTFLLAIAPVMDAAYVNVYGFDITVRKQAEERAKHLNSVLRAIRDVNQLIVREKDRGRLLQSVCDCLTEAHGYYNAWIALLDEEGDLALAVEAGVGEPFLSLVEQWKRGELPYCARATLSQADVLTVEDSRAVCAGCPLSDIYTGKSCIAVRLEHDGRVYGLLELSFSRQFAASEEERSLIREVAYDIAFALHGITLEEKRRQAEDALRGSEEAEHRFQERLRMLLEVSNRLSRTDFVDALCRQAVELGRTHLGFDRLGIWFRSPDTDVVVGSYSTDESGDLRDERGSRSTVDNRQKRILAQTQPITLRWDDVDLLDGDGNVVGHGAWAQAAMWDGERTIGFVSADNLLRGQPITEHDCELLNLYASTLGYLCSRKRAEEALASERALLRTIIDILPALVYAKDTEGYKFLSNQVDLEYMGAATEAEALGKTDFDFYPEDMAARFYARDQAIIQTGQPLVDYEHPIVTADGQQRWLLTSKAPLRDSAGQVTGLVGVGQDITARKQTEEALRESEEKYRNVVERANDGIIIIQDSLVQYANARMAEMWGGSVEEIAGTRFTGYIDPDELPTVAERYRQRMAGEQVTPIYATVLRRRNGEKVYVELNAGAITYQDRPADLVIIRDVTERIRSEEERAQAAAALQRYVERLRILRAIDSVILAAQSPQDIGQAVLRHLQRLVPSDRVLISSFDLEKGQATVLASLAGDETWLEAGSQIELKAFGGIANLWEGKVSIVGDAQALDETPLEQSGVLVEGIRSYIHIPLVVQSGLIGSILLAAENPAAFTTEHVEVAGELSGQLAIGIHQARLRKQIRRHTQELEQQVMARTVQLARRSAQLRVAAEVARDATTAHSLDDLLDNAVNLVRDRFGFYHAGIFITDQRGEYAVLRSATGEAGRQMLEHEHRLKVGQVGIVGHVCASGEPRIALDTGADAVYFDNPFLPDTRSEMALPMRAGGRVIGALDVQSTDEVAFDQDDVEIMQVMADQLAVAIERTRLFEQVQATLEERLRTVISNAPVMLFALDREGVFTLAEGKGLGALEVTSADLVGHSVFELYGDASQVLDSVRSALAGEASALTAEVSDLTFDMWYSPLQDAGGEVTGVLGVAIDVTERRCMEEQMQRQERLAAVGQLAGGIAHDFNNFLMTIIFYAHLLLRDKDTSPNIASVAETIVGEANRAAALVRQVLDFSRRSVIETEPMDLSSFAAEVVDILQKTLPENIRVVTEMGEDDYTVEVDPTRIQQVIMNLALNSRDAMPDGGTLRIELSRTTVESTKMRLPGASDLELTTGDWVCLSVQDTGTGMDERVRAHLFEPFFTTKGSKGNGLGLAQVYGIVKQHRGEIDVETKVGRGTTFRIYLPAYMEKRRVAKSEEISAVPEGRGETILFVEDEEKVRDAGQRVLQSLGYRVLTASNGREGLEVFERAGEVDLVLTDMVMPEMGGKELIQELKRIAPDVKVLVITGYTMQEDVRALKEIGFVDIVYKPLDVVVLGKTVRRMLDRNTEHE